MNMTEWTNREDLANVVAGELLAAMEHMGIGVDACYSLDGDHVTVSFQDIRDAETMMSLGVTADARPGSLYDRATSSCVTLTAMAAADEPPDDGDVENALDAGWTWSVHPVMIGRRADWHVSLDLSPEDATRVTANLNTIRRAK